MELMISTSSAYLEARRKISVRYHKAIDGFEARLQALKSKHKQDLRALKSDKAAYLATHKKVMENLDKKYKVPPVPKTPAKKTAGN